MLEYQITIKVSKCFCSISVLISSQTGSHSQTSINQQTDSPACQFLVCRRDLSYSSEEEGKQNSTHYHQVSCFLLFPGLYSLFTSQLILESPATHSPCLSFVRVSIQQTFIDSFCGPRSVQAPGNQW